MLDVRAAVDALAPGGKVAVIGFCWGGTLAWLGAAELPIAGAVGYYGSQIGQHLERRPRCPAQLHFGGNDQSTPPAMIEGLRKAHAAVEVYVYAGAGHAFNRRGFPPYNEGAAATARIRTLAFLETVMR